MAPYVYEFSTYAKARWFGRELLEVFSKEFGANSPEYYRDAIKTWVMGRSSFHFV